MSSEAPNLVRENENQNAADPRTVYTERLAARKSERAKWNRLHLLYGNWRLALFLIGVAVGWAAFGAGVISGTWLLIPLAGFLLLAFRHDKVLGEKKRAERAILFYEQGLARLDNVWMGRGTSGMKFSDPNHPYAHDLDLFGKGSLYERLCAARTSVGERTLADWLTAPAAPDVIRARQAAAAELRPLLDLREDLAILGDAAKAGVEPNRLTDWGLAPAAVAGSDIRAVAMALAAFNLCAAGAWAAGYGYFPLIITVTLGQMVTRRQRGQAKSAMNDVEKPGRDLELLALLLERIEAAQFTAPLLKTLQADLGAGTAASARIARLQRLVELLEFRGNILFAFVDAILLFTFQVALQIEAWRIENGPHLAAWLRVAGEFEALSSLAGYAYECPADPFPEIREGGPLLEAGNMAHPLLPADSAVRNAVHFGDTRRLYIVSGSNMSGKSTFLRTIGANVILALAGAPVRAERFIVSPLQIGASLQTTDSLQAGISRFYAELLRLRQVLALTENEPPTLFLLDEILHGTNSHDRLIGAEALLRSLVARGAVGLATTHDLALADIAQDATLLAANVHFEDDITDGKMSFDYRLRPGVVEKSNALELMRSVGLDV